MVIEIAYKAIDNFIALMMPMKIEFGVVGISYLLP